MDWSLQFDKEHKIMDYFDQCDKKKEQVEMIESYIKKYSDPPFKPIEIGVGCAKYSDNWKVLDPYDKRDLVDYKFGLEDVVTKPVQSILCPNGMNLMYEFDLVKAFAIFEHTFNVQKCIEGCYYLLKKDGIFMADFPFAFPFHPFKGYDEKVHGLLADKNLPELKDDQEHGGDYFRFSPLAVMKLTEPYFEKIYLEKTNAGSLLYIGRRK